MITVTVLDVSFSLIYCLNTWRTLWFDRG